MKGILMTPEMVQAIREDRKTVTRRCGQLKEINEAVIPEPEEGRVCWVAVRKILSVGG